MSSSYNQTQVTGQVQASFKVAFDLQSDIFTRALVGFIDAQGHNQVIAPCQNFGMYIRCNLSACRETCFSFPVQRDVLTGFPF